MKKGFTLVELLAVLVVLSIILVIAVPKIQDIIGETKRNAAITNAYTIIKSSKIYALENGDYSVIDVLNPVLNYDGEMPTSGSIQTNIDEETRIAVLIDGWCVTKNFTDSEATAIKTDTCLLP